MGGHDGKDAYGVRFNVAESQILARAGRLDSEVKMRTARGVLLGLAATMPTAAYGQNYMEQCAKLLTPDDIQYRNDVTAHYAYNKVVSQKSSNENSMESGATVPMEGLPPIEGFLNLSQSEIASFLSNEGVEWSFEESLGYIAKIVAPDARTRFGECVRDVLNTPAAVRLEIREVSDDGVSLRLHLGPHPGQNKQFRLSLLTDGLVDNPIPRSFGSGGNKIDVFARRANPAKSLRVVAQIFDGDHQVSTDSLIVPPNIKATPVASRSDRTSDSTRAACGGARGRASHSEGPAVSLEAENNEIFDFKNASAEVVLTGGENGVLPNPEWTGLRWNTRTPKLISARSACGVWANETVFWEGRFSVPVFTYAVNVQTPEDNGNEVGALRESTYATPVAEIAPSEPSSEQGAYPTKPGTWIWVLVGGMAIAIIVLLSKLVRQKR